MQTSRDSTIFIPKQVIQIANYLNYCCADMNTSLLPTCRHTDHKNINGPIVTYFYPRMIAITSRNVAIMCLVFATCLPTYKMNSSAISFTAMLKLNTHFNMQCIVWLAAVNQAFALTHYRDVSSKNVTDHQRLVNTIFANYDKMTRPVWNFADVTNVTLNPALYSILDTDEAAESITIVQWFAMTWTDVFLQWNPADYGGMQELLIPINRIWYPDIYALNMISVTQRIPEKKNYASIIYNGTINISIDQVLNLRCNYNIIMFPFDIQNCTITFCSWAFSANQVDVFYATPTDLWSYNQNDEWDLISMSARRSPGYTNVSMPSPSTNIYYDFIIKRKPIYYLLTFVLPCFMITTISIIGIFAPFSDAGDREEKVSMGLTTLLTMTLVVTLIADQMPRSSYGMPLLGIYIMLQIGVAALSSLMAVIVMYQHRKWTYGEPIPTWILFATRSSCEKGPYSANKARIAAISEHCNKSNEISSFANSTSTNAFRQQPILKHLQSMVREMLLHIYEQNDEDNLEKEWQRACDSLDILLMIGFLVLNCVLTGGVLLIGYLNLKN